MQSRARLREDRDQATADFCRALGDAVDRITAAPVFAVTKAGHMAWVADSEYHALRQLVWLNGRGVASPAVSELGRYTYPRLSPDGRRIALTVQDETPDIWVLEIATGLRTRLTRKPVIEQRPMWSPDGRRVLYQGENSAFDLYSRAADASDSAILLYSTRFDKYPYGMTPDGRQLTVMEDSLNERVLVLTLGDTVTARGLAGGPYNQESPVLSADGRWLAFASNESGPYQIYVAPFGRGAEQPKPVTSGGVAAAADYAWLQWARDGRALYYASGDSLMRIPFDPRSGEASTPALLFRGTEEVADVAADGRIPGLGTPPETAPRRVRLVLNWRGEVAGTLEK